MGPPTTPLHPTPLLAPRSPICTTPPPHPPFFPLLLFSSLVLDDTLVPSAWTVLLAVIKVSWKSLSFKSQKLESETDRQRETEGRDMGQRQKKKNLHACVCVCVCVCVRARARARVRACIGVCVRLRARACVCGRQRERENQFFSIDSLACLKKLKQKLAPRIQHKSGINHLSNYDNNDRYWALPTDFKPERGHVQVLIVQIDWSAGLPAPHL